MAVDGGHDRRARHTGYTIGEEDPARIGDRRQAVLIHLHQAHLGGWSETVFGCSQDPETVMAVAFEFNHRVDYVLEHSRPGEGALFGDMAHKDQGNPFGLGDIEKFVGALPHLGHRSRRRTDLGIVHGLNRIDHDQVGAH